MIRFKLLSYSNFGKIQNWFEEMAKKGWELQSVKLSMFHFFEKTQAQKKSMKFF